MAEVADELKPKMDPSFWPITAPMIRSKIGKTYIKNVTFNKDEVLKLRTIRSPTLAPA